MNEYVTTLKTYSTQIYLAARFDRQDELQEYADILKQKGIEVTSRWLWMSAAYMSTPWQFKDICALMDYEDIERANVVISFTGDPEKTSRGGRHVEFGIGLALKKRMIIIGECEHIFHFMHEVEVYPNFATFITETLGT